MNRKLWKGRKLRFRSDTYNDRDGGGSAQDLLHQAISVVQRFHDLPLTFSDLKKPEIGKQRCLINTELVSLSLCSCSTNLRQNYSYYPD